MKRWKKQVSALLLALCLAGSLCACGGGNEPAPAPEPVPTPTPAPVEDVPQETETYVPEEVVVPEPEPEPEKEPEGLIILDSTIVSKGTAITQEGCTIYCLNPYTGETTVVANFVCKINIDLGDYFYYIPLATDLPTAYTFSEDYTKIAVTKRFVQTGEEHAGWLDQNGNFFDVTEALGQQRKSDFDNPVYYEAVGFSNGCFGFFQRITGSPTVDQYYVPVDNITSATVQTGDVRQKDHSYTEQGTLILGQYSGKYYPNDVTSWIDATHAIVNNTDNSVYNSLIVDTAAQTSFTYIPGDSRENWNGKVSPDGTKIAFLSAPKGGYKPDVDLYITPVDGGNPVKVEGHPFSFAYIDATYMDTGTCTLIGWK